MLITLALGSLAGAPREAAADEDTQLELARPSYERGDAAYQLGKFEEAARWFEQAYAAWPAVDLLYNIAQSYRRAGACEQAALAYRRYLARKEQGGEAPLSAEDRAGIERFIREATACVAHTLAAPAPAAPPPTLAAQSPTQPAPPPTQSDAAEGAAVSAGEAAAGTAVEPTWPISVYAAVGTSWFDSSGAIGIPAQVALAVGGRYALPAGPVIVEVGARGAFSPIGYDVMDSHQWASLASVMATAGATLTARHGLSAQAELGAGLARLGGLVAYNPFTVSRNAATITMLALRLGLAAEYAITPRLRATLPSLGLTVLPAPPELATHSIMQLELLLGVGYRM